MRTTLTLDDDIAARLQAEARRSGLPFKVVVNEHLRAALANRKSLQTRPPFRIEPRDFGGPVPGLTYDNIGVLLEEGDGARQR
jgi:hypothetical protein